MSDNTVYNQEQKVKFINSIEPIPSMKYRLLATFQATADHESHFGKDLCEMNEEELRESVSSLMQGTWRAKLNALSLLKKYGKWCLKESVPGANDNISKIDVSKFDRVRSIKKAQVATPIQLHNILNKMYRPVEEVTADNIRRGYLWIAFSGVPKESADDVKVSDVDFENMRIVFNGVDFPLYREEIPVLRSLVESNYFNYHHSNPSYDTQKNRTAGDVLLRGTRGSTESWKLANHVNIDAKEAYENGLIDVRISYISTKFSGIFYRAYEIERSGEDVDFALDPSLAFSTLENRKQTARNMKRDYIAWKFAFEL